MEILQIAECLVIEPEFGKFLLASAYKYEGPDDCTAEGTCHADRPGDRDDALDPALPSNGTGGRAVHLLRKGTRGNKVIPCDHRKRLGNENVERDIGRGSAGGGSSGLGVRHGNDGDLERKRREDRDDLGAECRCAEV